MSPQNERILKWLKKNPNKWLTTLIATQELGILRLSERIAEISYTNKSTGILDFHACRFPYQIEKKWQEVTNRFGDKCRVMGYRLK